MTSSHQMSFFNTPAHPSVSHSVSVFFLIRMAKNVNRRVKILITLQFIKSNFIIFPNRAENIENLAIS